ncbi:MAG: ComEC/Rec2 family competence protein [Solirubrobacteraceae bacterium]|nr:ComEC/Rec2 family competence protein [Solirubrobacteraceae bacterium]
MAAALAAGGAAGGPLRATALVVVAGIALAAPSGRRSVALAIFLAAAWGGVRTGMIDHAAAPVVPAELRGEQITLLETLPAHGPAMAAGVAARARCHGRVIVVSPARYGRPTPLLRRGWIVLASGRLVPLGGAAGDGRLARQGVAGRLLLTDASDSGRRRGGLFGAVDGLARGASQAAVHAGGPRAGPLLAGMALGTAEEVRQDDRELLRAAGLWHLAAASGGNVALVVALCFVLGWLAGLPDRARLLLSLVAVIAYVPLAGAGPSIQRAGVMGCAALLALLAGREHRTVDALGLAAAATLAVDPRAWMDVGWQLSFAATAALLLGAGPLQRRLRRLGVPRPIGLPVAATVLATLATTPIMLATFGSVSAVGLVTNVAAAPIAAVTVWSGALAAVVAPWSAGVARLVAEPGAAGASATLAIAEWGAGRAHAQLGGQAVVLAFAGAAILAVIRPGRQLTLLIGVALVVVVVLDVPRPPSEPRLVVFDIGQGSAALLQDGAEAVLVDAGPVDGGVVAQLRQAGVRRLRAIVLSHPAADHDGGAAAVLRAFPTDLVLDGGAPGGGPTHTAAIREAGRRHVRVLPVRAGQRFRAGRIDVRIRWPTPAAAARPGDPNDRAAVVQATLGDLRALIPADAEGNVLEHLTGLRADVLVVSHHGSEDPELPRVLRTLRPAVAVISVGAHNGYRHPRPETLAALRSVHVPTLRTDHGGSVDLRRATAGLTIRRIASP